MEAAKDHREEEEAKDDDAVLREDVIKVGPPPNVEQKLGSPLRTHLYQVCVHVLCVGSSASEVAASPEVHP